MDKILFYLKKCFKEDFANFKGRARREEYWYFVLGCGIVSIAVSILVNIAVSILACWSDLILACSSGLIFACSWVLSRLLGLVFLVPGLAVGARRLHDTGRSGWWQLLSFVPVIGGIVLLVWFATAGKPEENKWGANPKLGA